MIYNLNCVILILEQTFEQWKAVPIKTGSKKVLTSSLSVISFTILVFPFINKNSKNLANGKDMQRMINTHVEAGKIGRQIAEQVMDSQKRCEGSSSASSPDPDPEPSIQVSSAEVLIVMF